MSDFILPALRELTDQQVRFAPPVRRREQLARAEKLLTEIVAARAYPYQYICFRLTDYRSDAYPEMLMVGGDVRHDLQLFMDRVARSLQNAPAGEHGEPLLSLAEVSQRLNVSTKTVVRWRRLGLIGQRVVREGRRQLGFPASVVEQFVASHPDLVRRGGRFSHLSDDEKEEILRRAKRLSGIGGNLTEICRRIAQRIGRSTEAVRYTIKNFDRAHPESALFPDVQQPLGGEAKEVIFNSYRKGIPVDTLAKRYGRTRSAMYRVINEVRAERLLAQPLDYIYHESFDMPAKAAEMLADMPKAEEFWQKKRDMKAPRDVPPELVSLYEWPLLSKDQEQHLFRKMNFLKHQLKQVRDRVGADLARARVSDLQEIERLQCEVNQVKELLINCNMRLVASIAKKHVGATGNIFELISDGNMSLMRAVEKFDFSRGFKFSTYATWAIMKNYARSIPDEQHHRERYVTGHEDVFEAAADQRSDEQEVLSNAEQKKQIVNRLLDTLDPREREIIRLRAGLDGSEPKTLEQIGQCMGITKERVRQIHVRGMRKMRESGSLNLADLS